MFDQEVNAIQDRWYQEECVDSLFEYYETPGGVDKQGVPNPRNPLIALPTGTGKSVIIAKFCKRVFDYHPRSRVIMATHVKELIKQNARQMQKAWPLAPIGIHSAGLGQRDIAQPIIFGGIKSMVKNAKDFGAVDFLVIDEVHLAADEGNYATFIAALKEVNPWLRVVGLSATIYRMGLGLLTNGQIFTDIVYDLSNVEGFNRLIAEGFLCPLFSKPTNVELDVSNVDFGIGDYIQSQVEREVNKHEITLAALNEFVAYGKDRRSWLIFASGISHANNICEMLNNYYGIPSVVIHSKRSKEDNSKAMEAWKSGEVRCAVNMNGLTTGVDHPPLDYIGCLRPTLSTGLWVQMLGRGTRPYPGKQNCLVMDFAGNTRRLGPINDPIIPRFKNKGEPGDAPVKICSLCGVYNHARAAVCIACGSTFFTDAKISKHASTQEVMVSDTPQVEEFEVTSVHYSKHISRATGNVSLKCSYFCNRFRTFYEYVSFESKGFALKIARDWFRQRYGEPVDGMTVDDVLLKQANLQQPRIVRVWLNKRGGQPQILGVEF